MLKNAGDYIFIHLPVFVAILFPSGVSGERFLIVFEVLPEMRIFSGLLFVAVIVIVLLIVFEVFKSFRRKTH